MRVDARHDSLHHAVFALFISSRALISLRCSADLLSYVIKTSTLPLSFQFIVGCIMRLGSTLISSATFLGAFARSAAQDNAAHESIVELPDGWKSVGEADGSLPLTLSVALKQPRMSELEAHLQNLSDPSHAKYGAHLSQDEISNFQQPDQDGLDAVRSWLNANGVPFSVEGSWLRINTTVDTASNLIDADFGRYQYNDDSPVLRATKYSLPREVADYVDFVYPVTQFIRKPSKKALPSLESHYEKRQDSCT